LFGISYFRMSSRGHAIIYLVPMRRVWFPRIGVLEGPAQTRLWPSYFPVADHSYPVICLDAPVMRSLGHSSRPHYVTPYSVSRTVGLLTSALVNREAVSRHLGCHHPRPCDLFCAKLQPWNVRGICFHALPASQPSQALLIYRRGRVPLAQSEKNGSFGRF